MTFRSRGGVLALAVIPFLQACGGFSAETETLQSEQSPNNVVPSAEQSASLAETDASGSSQAQGEPSEASGEPSDVDSSAASIDGWSTFESVDGGFSVLLPDDVRSESSQSVDTEVGPVTLSMTLAEISNDRAYAASYTEYPAGTMVDLDGAVEGSITNSMPGGTFLSKETDFISGFECRRYVVAGQVEAKDAELASIICAIRSRLIQAIAIGDPGIANHPETEIFFNSFLPTDA